MIRFLLVFILTGLLMFSFSHEERVIKENLREEISYPKIVKIHPPIVHFAIAIPIFTLILQGFYYIRKKKPDDIELLAISFSSLSVIGASITGYIAHESIEEIPISSKALEILHTHETLGIILGILFATVLLFRIAYSLKSSGFLRILYVILFLVGTFLILYQGFLGGKLVYDFGIGVGG